MLLVPVQGVVETAMIKRDELTNPDSCMSRAQDDEPTFVLLARDDAAPDTILAWAAKRISIGKNTISDPQIKEALALADAMEEWRRKNR